MGKKIQIKDAAAAGTTVLDSIAKGGVQYVQDVQDVQNVQDTQDVKAVKEKDPRGRKPSAIPHERLNLKIPTDIKEYLTVAAAKASIDRKKKYTLTDYLCEIVRADMEKHKDD